MTKLSWVNVYPPTGHPDQLWLDHPDEDAFARSSRSVCELYTEAVRAARIEARHSELRLFCLREEGRDDVLVEVDTDRGEGFEGGTVTLPPGVAELPAPVRAALALEVVHAAAVRLGQDRGWDLAALAQARQHVLDNRLRFRWEGPPKVSPDRKLTAAPVFVLHDDGYGRVTVQIRARDDGRLVAVSEPALAFSTSAGFARSARTLRWRGSQAVEMTPYEGLSAGFGGHTIWRDSRGRLTLDVDAGIPTLASDDDPDVAAALSASPAVVVSTYAEREPLWMHIRLSDTENLHRLTEADYEYEIIQVDLGELANESAEWRAWWQLSGLAELEVDMHSPTAAPNTRGPPSSASIAAASASPGHARIPASPATRGHRRAARPGTTCRPSSTSPASGWACRPPRAYRSCPSRHPTR
ncbi:hypothetical protein OWR29_18080 [Actinoplanes sp. Pm04-4]|uniref:Uncharacterized protein n=1 Tax=Paractinoplanes pyxinae TaxID=2997416 RepID=A0ABT4B226_9ACTN|nr:hypothetical protein [Actinoplanes pyxinae]MCY1139915.1 hypothetical protein [Actinoplanes pyxinae]